MTIDAKELQAIIDEQRKSLAADYAKALRAGDLRAATLVGIQMGYDAGHIAKDAKTINRVADLKALSRSAKSLQAKARKAHADLSAAEQALGELRTAATEADKEAESASRAGDELAALTARHPDLFS